MGNNAVSMFTPNAGMMGAANAAMRAGGKQAFYGSAYDAATQGDFSSHGHILTHWFLSKSRH